MHKIKKAMCVLQKHLGRDSVGIKLLDNIAGIANDLRRDAATANRDAASAENSKSLLDDKRQSAEIDRDRTAGHLVHAKSCVRQKERDIINLTKQIAALEEQVDQSYDDIDLPIQTESVNTRLLDTREFIGMFNSLRRKQRVAPKVVTRQRPDVGTWELSLIIKDYSGAEMMKLGQFVTALAMLNMPVAIQAERNMSNAKAKGNLLEGKQLDSAIKWIQPLIEKDYSQFANTRMPIPSYHAHENMGRTN